MESSFSLLLSILMLIPVVGAVILMFMKDDTEDCLLYTSPSPRDGLLSRMPSSA